MSEVLIVVKSWDENVNETYFSQFSWMRGNEDWKDWELHEKASLTHWINCYWEMRQLIKTMDGQTS